ncbi:hypothetical protein [Providencia stuartii]|uniref:hypothetical protein n=1 Tax=Providencia stuartii TaxID=588 RepID=UPI001874B6AB|nr:hypothetical protein [Providencia thailandensis]GHB90057.1 hypothetical protein GCM10007290_15260 [Providencia thailandensis]
MNNLSVDKKTVELKGYTAHVKTLQNDATKADPSTDTIDMNEPLFFSVKLSEEPKYINSTIKLSWATVFCNIMNEKEVTYCFCNSDEQKNKDANVYVKKRIDECIANFESQAVAGDSAGFIVLKDEIFFNITFNRMELNKYPVMDIEESVENTVNKINHVVTFINDFQSIFYCEEENKNIPKNEKAVSVGTLKNHIKRLFK